MEVYDLTTNADENNANPPDGFPRGMQFEEVNDAFRELMAALRRDQVNNTIERLSSPDSVPEGEMHTLLIAAGNGNTFNGKPIITAGGGQVKLGTLGFGPRRVIYDPERDAYQLLSPQNANSQYEFSKVRTVTTNAPIELQNDDWESLIFCPTQQASEVILSATDWPLGRKLTFFDNQSTGFYLDLPQNAQFQAFVKVRNVTSGYVQAISYAKNFGVITTRIGGVTTPQIARIWRTGPTSYLVLRGPYP